MATTNKLLILEDGAQITGLLMPQAQSRGYELVTYRDATGVLVMARQLQADAMLLDSQLRGAGSVIALKAFRRNVNTAALPVVAVLGRTGPKAEDLKAAGAQAVVSEPYDARKLFDAVDSNLQAELDFTAGPAQALAEPAQVEATEAANVIDTPPEPAFDRLTKLSAQLLMAPVTLATFVTRTRQFFKSAMGLAEPWATERGTPLTHSFCQWVVSSKEPLVVDDAREHAVLKSNLAIRDLGVIAYAGVPMTGKGGLAIGSFCAIDTKPRKWTEDDLKTLHDLAVIAETYSHPDPARHRNAVEAASRILRRYGPRLRDAEREQLLDIIEEQTLRLVPR
ncbi:MAG TPA: GAF domain-containing protein [Usitatibacter sp.]|nr:GAF domain-containing protein [Usitatibacter sp.]